MNRKIRCLCEKELDVEAPELWDMNKDPQWAQDILSGHFMEYRCADCNTNLKPEFPLTIKTKEGNLWNFLPEAERFSLDKTIAENPKADRIIIGYKELVEKLRLYQEGLDDRVIEILKLPLYTKASGMAEEEQGTVRVLFIEKKGDKIVFHVYGIKKGEVGEIRMDYKNYEQVLSNIASYESDEAYSEILKKPYISCLNLD